MDRCTYRDNGRQGVAIKINVSVGDAIDRATILAIKRTRIADDEKRRRVEREFTRLCEALKPLGIDEDSPHFVDLLSINRRIWDLKDAARLKERAKCFDDEFIEIARDIYRRNDERSRLKRQIDLAFGLEPTDEKQYPGYGAT